MNNNNSFKVLGAVCALLFATNSSATLILNGPPGGSGDVENVLFNCCPGQSGTTVTGALNQSGLLVNITSDETLKTPAGGQARVEAADGSLTMLMIELADPYLAFSKIIFNIDAVANGSATVTLWDQFDTAFVFANQALRRNGSNWFTGLGLDGQLIVKASINSQVGISDVQQIRIGPTSLPEPGTLWLLGIGLVAAAWGRRRDFKATLGEPSGACELSS